MFVAILAIISNCPSTPVQRCLWSFLRRLRPVARQNVASLTARRSNRRVTQKLHLFLHGGHGSQVFHIQLLSCMFEVVNCQLNLIHERIHLGPVLVVDVCNIHPALLEQQLFVLLGPRVALTIALLTTETTAAIILSRAT